MPRCRGSSGSASTTFLRAPSARSRRDEGPSAREPRIVEQLGEIGIARRTRLRLRFDLDRGREMLERPLTIAAPRVVTGQVVVDAGAARMVLQTFGEDR